MGGSIIVYIGFVADEHQLPVPPSEKKKKYVTTLWRHPSCDSCLKTINFVFSVNDSTKH
jgi:hypothetical protein